MDDGIRLQKFLSRAGRASRREAEELMLAGRVRVNGAVIQELGVRVVPGRDRVELDGVGVEIPTARWIAYHKQAGSLTTRRDPHGGRTVYHGLPPELRPLRYVGRLDRDTEGLLLFTNDGDGAHALQHPSGEVEREYRVEVAGGLPGHVLARLRKGVSLDDGPARAKRANIIEQSTDRTALSVVITEGRKREIRRMMYAVGHPVVRLKRVRFGPIVLGSLGPGEWRVLTEDERIRLLAVAGGRES